MLAAVPGPSSPAPVPPGAAVTRLARGPGPGSGGPTVPPALPAASLPSAPRTPHSRATLGHFLFLYSVLGCVLLRFNKTLEF